MSDENIPRTEPISTAPEPFSELITPVHDQSQDTQPIAAEEPAPEPVGEPTRTPAEGQSLNAEPAAAEEPTESFADVLSAFERTPLASRRNQTVARHGRLALRRSGLPRHRLQDRRRPAPLRLSTNNAEDVKPGDTFPVSVTGRNEEGYYELSRFRVAQPRDWSALEAAFAEKTAVAGTVTAVIKGGLSVDIGVRAFMPASRSGTRDAAELEELVGTEITCRITKLDVTDEDVVVDRRVVLEEQARGALAGRRAALKEGDTVTGTVRTLMPYGAFVEIERPRRPAPHQRHLPRPRRQA